MVWVVQHGRLAKSFLVLKRRPVNKINDRRKNNWMKFAHKRTKSLFLAYFFAYKQILYIYPVCVQVDKKWELDREKESGFLKYFFNKTAFAYKQSAYRSTCTVLYVALYRRNLSVLSLYFKDCCISPTATIHHRHE